MKQYKEEIEDYSTPEDLGPKDTEAISVACMSQDCIVPKGLHRNAELMIQTHHPNQQLYRYYC